MPLATLSIDLVAQLAKFEADMGRAARVAEQASARMARGSGGIGAVFKGSLLAGEVEEAVRQMSSFVPQLVDGVAHLQDLEEKTGASAVALAGFQTSADVAGISTDELAGLMVKLTGTLSKTNDETKGAGGALKALGLDLEQFKRLAPEEQFLTLAQQLDGFQDGAGKTAIAIALLGKSGAEALPFLKELAQTGLTQNRLTAEQIRLADDLSDRNARLRSELRQAAQVAALQALPAFNALFEELGKIGPAITGVDEAADDLGVNSGIRAFAEDAAVGLAAVADAAVFANKALQLMVSSFKAAGADISLVASFIGNPRAAAELVAKGTGPLKEALDARNAAVADANKRLKDLMTGEDFEISKGLQDRFAKARLGEQLGVESIGKVVDDANAKKPKLTFNLPDEKGAKAAAEARKAALQAALKDLERTFASERDAVQFQQRYLQAQYSQGLIDLRNFFEQRAALEQRALDLQLANDAAEVAALRKSLDAPDSSDADRIRTKERIADIEAKSALARQQFAQDAKLAALDEARAYVEAGDRITEFRAQVLELQGDLARAAELRAGLAINQARRSAGGLGLTPEDLQAFEEATRRVDDFRAAQFRAERAIDDTGLAEARFLRQAEASGATRAEIERGLTEIRRRGVEQLGEFVLAAERATEGLGPDSPAVQGAKRLREEYERAAADVDVLGQRLREFADATASQIAGSITDALIDGDWRGAGRRIAADLNRAILEEEFTKPLQEQLRNFLRAGIPGAENAIGQLGNSVARLFGFEGLVSSSGSAAATAATTGAQQAAVAAGARAVGGVAAQTASAAAAAAADAALTALSATAAATGASLTLLDAQVVALGVSSLTLDASLIALASAAASATAAIASMAAASAAGAAAKGAGDAASIFASFAGAGFAAGGYTGDAPSTAPAGVVHGGEYVFSAPAVAAVGVPALERLHRSARRGAPTAIGLPGYAAGGFVRSPPAGKSSAAIAGSQVNHYVVQVTATPGMTRATALQQGAALMDGLRRAQRNR